MEAILAGRDDFAAALADLGFANREYCHALQAGSTSESLDKFSGNARIVKSAICAGNFRSPFPLHSCFNLKFATTLALRDFLEERGIWRWGENLAIFAQKSLCMNS